MSNPDVINFYFQIITSGFILNNCRILFYAKTSQSISIVSSVYFFLISIFSLYYYTTLEQIYSTLGAIWLMLCNFIYLLLILTFRCSKP